MRVRAGICLTTLAVSAACGGHDTPRAEKPAPLPSRSVVTAEVTLTGGTGEIAAPGAVQSRRRAALSARIPASVTELPYREGQRVEEGAIVVRLDDVALRAAVAAAEAGQKAAEADLERTRALLAKNAATPRELEQMTAQAAAAQAQVSGARDSLSYAVLRAPFAGRVANRHVNLGDVVNPGMPLVEIEGEGGLELRATVEPSVAEALRPGAKLRAAVDGLAAPLDATVTAVAPSGDATTHRFEVTADLPAAAGLRAGLFARLLVPGIASAPRLTVPSVALFERGGLTGVFVVDDGVARLRWVAAGARDGATVEVRAGVEAGERVVLGPVGLVDGTPVTPTAAADPAPPAPGPGDPGRAPGETRTGGTRE
jgi:membrane fusion protein, multidrug efflux system